MLQAWIYRCHLYPPRTANFCRISRHVVDEDDDALLHRGGGGGG